MHKNIARILIVSLLIITGCATLQYPPPPTPEDHSLPPAERGTLTEVASRFAEIHPGEQSGFLLLTPNNVAFKWRLALIDHATESIDVQYFIWQRDETGLLLFDRLLKAADRGVRVRVLVDDLLFASKDRSIAAITRHPNFDIKIFNPGRVRDSTLGRWGEFLLYFRQLNRRMHNKMFVADNQLAIIGGRNIGNEYFGLGKKYNFRDLDVLVTGPVVEEISDAFDVYWNSDLSYPGGAMSQEATYEEVASMRDRLADFFNYEQDVLASYPIGLKTWEEKLMGMPSQMHTGIAHFIQDQPVTHGGEEYRLDHMIRNIAGPVAEEFILVTPYLIPGSLLKRIAEATADGMRIKILTGSLGANNHTLNHLTKSSIKSS